LQELTDIFTPGDTFTPRGQLRLWDSKFAPSGKVKNGPQYFKLNLKLPWPRFPFNSVPVFAFEGVEYSQLCIRLSIIDNGKFD
jgi:hypothetical protein